MVLPNQFSKKEQSIMKKFLILFVFIVCIRLSVSLVPRLMAKNQESPQAATTPAVETTVETEPTTVPPTQPGAVVESHSIAFESGYETEATALAVTQCRMYTLDNGYTRFEVDYQTVEGLRPIAFAYIGDSHHPAFWYESETRTTTEADTLVFEMETQILTESNGPDVHFQNRSYESVSYILIYPDQFLD